MNENAGCGVSEPRAARSEDTPTQRPCCYDVIRWVGVFEPRARSH